MCKTIPGIEVKDKENTPKYGFNFKVNCGDGAVFIKMGSVLDSDNSINISLEFTAAQVLEFFPKVVEAVKRAKEIAERITKLEEMGQMDHARDLYYEEYPNEMNLLEKIMRKMRKEVNPEPSH